MNQYKLPRICFPYVLAVLLAALWGPIAHGQAFDSGHFVGLKIPTQLVTQAREEIEIIIKNVGTEAWTSGNGVVLAIGDAGNGQSWGLDKVELGGDEIIGPGETKVFKFDIVAPEQPGSYVFSWQLLRGGKPIPGIHSPGVPIRVDNPLTRAKFVSQLVPDRVGPGEKFKVLVQFENAGEASWSDENGFLLKAISPNAQSVWGIGSVKLSPREFIAPGQTVTFNFEAVAPRKAGDYSLQWQMHHDKSAAFGEPSADTLIRVGQPEPAPISDSFQAQLLSQTVPEVMLAGDEYTITIVYKNTGDSPWRYRNIGLISQEPDNNLNWLINRVELNPDEVVQPGAMKVFTFKVRAPIDAGRYPFRWRLADRENRKFGQATDELSVTVK